MIERNFMIISHYYTPIVLLSVSHIASIHIVIIIVSKLAIAYGGQWAFIVGVGTFYAVVHVNVYTFIGQTQQDIK